jgi:hypothetical protein
MIRRDAGADDDHVLLITQHDHARLSGQLARRLGNGRFAPPAPFEEVIEAIAHHDAGWPLHDDAGDGAPTLNRDGVPLHVFEASAALAVQVWSASVARAMDLGDYQGLLVSLHVLNLSGINLVAHAKEASRADLFEINKFQHRQVEIQEELRRRLGLSTDVPRQLGLAAPGTSEAEDRLRFNFRLLTAMDRVSLALCVGRNLFPTMDDVHPRPGEPPAPIRCALPERATMTLDPWPFDRTPLACEVPARRVGRGPYKNVDDFRRAYRAARVEPILLTVQSNL